MNLRQTTNQGSLKAVIYCRVSSEKQVKEGNGLDSQEHRCREYATNLGLEVDKVFRDEGISGGLFERPAMLSLIKFLDSNWQNKYVVIFDDLKRFARDVEVHLRLKSELRAREAQLRCLNYNFDDSAEGEFVETIFAAQNELERKQNKRQVCQKMKARIERGYWCFYPPTGYQYIKDKEHGKLLAPLPEITDILSKGIIDFAEERIASQADLARYYEQNELHKLLSKKAVYLEFVKRALTDPLYAGIIEYPEWGVSKRKGHHKAIISEEIFNKVQHKLKRDGHKPRPADNVEFPLRQLVNCSVCGKKMTASVCKGKYKYYPHYTCNNRECTVSPKNITASKVENDYIKLLENITVEEGVLEIVAKIAREIWEKKASVFAETLKSNEKAKKELVDAIDDYIDLIPKTKVASVREKYEAKIEILDQRIKELEIKERNKKTPNINEALKLMLKFLGTPAETWKNAGSKLKIAIHNMIFMENPTYCLETGFGTPKLSLPFLIKQHIADNENGLVEVPRVALGSKRLKSYNLQV